MERRTRNGIEAGRLGACCYDYGFSVVTRYSFIERFFKLAYRCLTYQKLCARVNSTFDKNADKNHMKIM